MDNDRNIKKDHEIKKLKKKLQKYEEMFNKILNDDSDADSESDDEISLETYKIISVMNKNSIKDGVIYKRAVDGTVEQKVDSKLGESFMIIDNKEAELEELSKNEKNAVMIHENLAKIDKAKGYVSKGTIWYGWGATVASLGKYFIGFL